MSIQRTGKIFRQEPAQLVCDTLEALLRFGKLRSWAEESVVALGRSPDDPVRSAWYLEIVADGSNWPFIRRKACPASGRAVETVLATHPDLGGLWAEFEKRRFVHDCPEELAPDAAQLQRHAEVVRRCGGFFQQHPTYWAVLFGKLGATSEPSSDTSPAAPRNET